MTKRLVSGVVVLASVMLVCGLGGCKKTGESSATPPLVSLETWDNIEKMDGKFCVSLGWEENESGQRQKKGFEDAFKVFGGEPTFANANYDPKKQSEQIDAFIEMKPRAIFITPSDPAGITQACQRAVDAGIPIFIADAIVAGVPATTSICSSDFRMGAWTMDYIARHLKGKGNIAMIDLPENEAWDLRGQGARFALMEYPDIKVVQVHHHDSQTSISPLQAVESMLAAHPKGKLDAIWCAWDGAAQEGAEAIETAGRADEIITTGIDGGKHAFEIIKKGGPFKVTMAQSIYYMSFMDVYYAYLHLKGKQAPRFVISPVFAVDKAKLDALDAKFKPEDYDVPGNAAKFGWTPEL
ncbi:MAG: sugar ABC transporter substrate-binding protein [Phycisphaerae bacterium]|nr:sugar ABC transporter substrate-binding protein [Phycisphaerae bacterium]